MSSSEQNHFSLYAMRYPVLLSYVVPVKSTRKISQNFVAISECMSFTSKIYTYHLQWLHASPPVVVCKVGSISESIFILFPFSESSTFSLYFSVHQMPTSNLEVLWVFFLQFDKRICSMAGFFFFKLQLLKKV